MRTSDYCSFLLFILGFSATESVCAFRFNQMLMLQSLLDGLHHSAIVATAAFARETPNRNTNTATACAQECFVSVVLRRDSNYESVSMATGSNKKVQCPESPPIAAHSCDCHNERILFIHSAARHSYLAPFDGFDVTHSLNRA